MTHFGRDRIKSGSRLDIIRNEIAHNYDSSQNIAIEILNGIFESRNDLRKILQKINNLTREY